MEPLVNKSCIFCVVILVFCLAGTAPGRVIYVDDDGPADFNNIQPAINDANDADTVIVQPGLYRECVRFHGKNITLTSTNPGDFNTVAAPVIEHGAGFVGTEGPNCTLIGFKIDAWISGFVWTWRENVICMKNCVCGYGIIY